MLKPPHSLRNSLRPAHHLPDVRLRHILEYRLDLVRRRRVLGDVEVEGLAGHGRGRRGGRRVGGADGGRLVGGLACVGGGLLEEVDDAGGGGGVGLVEEGDDVEGLALWWER